MALSITPTMIKRSLLSRSFRHRILFVHMPKCGGTSLANSIMSRYSLKDIAMHRIYGLRHWQTWEVSRLTGKHVLDIRANILMYLLSDPEMLYVAGHFPVFKLLMDNFKTSWNMVSMLRDPVDRWFSGFFAVKTRPKIHELYKIEDDIADFIGSKQSIDMGNMYIQFFAWDGPDKDYTTPEAFEEAIQRAEQLKIIGFLEHLDLFNRDFERHFGLPLDIRHENINPVKKYKDREEITDSIIEKVQAICKPNIDFYNYFYDKLIKHR